MKKTILITGAAGNLGSAVVQQFLSDGDRVIAVDSPGRTINSTSPELELVQADLLNEHGAAQVISDVVKKHRGIDAAMLLVGGYAPGSVAETTGDVLRKMYSLNFESAYFVARPVFTQMLRQPGGGRIVLMGARTALRAGDGKGSLAYALSKSLIFKLAELLNAEGASKNVVTSVVVPSTIDTPVNRAAMPNADFSAWVKPGAIAEVLAFLASEKSSPMRDPIIKLYGNA